MPRYRWRTLCLECPTDMWDRVGVSASSEEARKACAVLAGINVDLKWRESGQGWVAWDEDSRTAFLIDLVAPVVDVWNGRERRRKPTPV